MVKEIELSETTDTNEKSSTSQFVKEGFWYAAVGGPAFLVSILKNKHFITGDEFKTVIEKSIVYGTGITGSVANLLLCYEVCSDFDYESIRSTICEIDYESALEYLANKKDQVITFGVLKGTAYGGFLLYKSLVFPRRLKERLRS